MRILGWAEAKDYAEASAQTWTSWAMNCAARCYDRLEDWEQAELWTQRQTERYPNASWPYWYLFGKRTGHGDLKTAQKWAEDYLPANETRPDLADQQMAAYFYWLSGSPKKALDLFGKLFAANSLPGTGVNLALIADELGDKARRETVLEELWHQAARQGTQDGQSLPDDARRTGRCIPPPLRHGGRRPRAREYPRRWPGKCRVRRWPLSPESRQSRSCGEIPEVLCRFAHRRGQAGAGLQVPVSS